MAKVCLIDGSGYIFRAFYALPTMTAPDGTPVNAVYGFLTMFMRLIKAIPCDYCVVLFDAKRKNFRNNFFADYLNHLRTSALSNHLSKFLRIIRAILKYTDLD